MVNFNKTTPTTNLSLKFYILCNFLYRATSGPLNPSVDTKGSIHANMKSFKKLSTKKTKQQQQEAAPVPENKESYKYLLKDHCKLGIVDDQDHAPGGGGGGGGSSTPTGYFPVYVGEERRRFVVRTSVLSHPLFKMLLEKASDEFGFKQSNGLVVPCSVSVFQEVINSVECCNGKFEFGSLVDEFL